MVSGWTRTKVETLADPRSFLRGLAYQRDGRVEIVKRSESTVVARVRGSMPYEVELRASGEPGWSCTCPVGEDGTFCKHCVAVALEVAGPEPAAKRTARRRPSKEPDLRRYVASLDVGALVELVMEQAESDWRLRERLQAAALAAGGGSLDLRTWKSRIDAVFGGRDFVPYAEAGGWAQDVFDVIAALDDLVGTGHAAAVVHLAEHAHRRADKAVQYIDDSDGWLTDISGRIAEVHLEACRAARPDPVELAGRLADLELTSELDTFHRAAATYAEVLGAEGIAAYRGIVEPKWRKAKTAKDRYAHGVFAATQAMIGVAQAGGDPEDLIAIRAGDLRTPDDYLEIAECLAAADRSDDAIDWSRRGLDAFADRHRQTPGLREFLAARLRAGHDTAGAEQLWWDAFEQHPSLDGYRKLITETSTDAVARKEQAIDALRQRLEAGDTASRTRNPLLDRSPATTLVEILLYEGRSEDASTAAVTHGCDERTWMTLARAREATDPLDAVPVYERAVAAQIETKKNGGYRAAVDLLSRIRTLTAKAGEPQRFRDLLAALTAEHGRKRNLMALIEKKGWT
ncbi:MAG: SWIM zinc finger family protein [Acidimicrobiia bacterium]